MNLIKRNLEIWYKMIFIFKFNFNLIRFIFSLEIQLSWNLMTEICFSWKSNSCETHFWFSIIFNSVLLNSGTFSLISKCFLSSHKWNNLQWIFFCVLWSSDNGFTCIFTNGARKHVSWIMRTVHFLHSHTIFILIHSEAYMLFCFLITEVFVPKRHNPHHLPDWNLF